jgi:hypothetical protein
MADGRGAQREDQARHARVQNQAVARPALPGFIWRSRMATTRKIGRDAETGHFKPVKDAERDKKGSVVERIKVPSPPPPPKKKP